MYYQFIENYLPNYYTDQRVADITDIEKKLDEDSEGLSMREYGELKEELRRLTTECFDDALSNYINKKYKYQTK